MDPGIADPGIAVLLAIIVVGIPLVVKEFKDIRKQANHTGTRQTIVETKLDILLDHAGLDIVKVNRRITERIEELKQNDRPSVGCIDVKELYKDAK